MTPIEVEKDSWPLHELRNIQADSIGRKKKGKKK